MHKLSDKPNDVLLSFSNFNMIKLLNKLKHDSSSFYTYHHSTGAQTIAVLQRDYSFGPFFQFTLIIAFVLIILIFSAFLKEAVSLSYTESGTGIEKTDTCNNQKHSLKTCHKIRGFFSNRIFFMTTLSLTPYIQLMQGVSQLNHQ